MFLVKVQDSLNLVERGLVLNIPLNLVKELMGEARLYLEKAEEEALWDWTLDIDSLRTRVTVCETYYLIRKPNSSPAKKLRARRSLKGLNNLRYEKGEDTAIKKKTKIKPVFTYKEPKAKKMYRRGHDG